MARQATPAPRPGPGCARGGGRQDGDFQRLPKPYWRLETGLSLGGKKNRVRNANRNDPSRGHVLLHGSLLKNGWGLAAVGGWRPSALRGWWRLAVGSGCRLPVGGSWGLSLTKKKEFLRTALVGKAVMGQVLAVTQRLGGSRQQIKEVGTGLTGTPPHPTSGPLGPRPACLPVIDSPLQRGLRTRCWASFHPDRRGSPLPLTQPPTIS